MIVQPYVIALVVLVLLVAFAILAGRRHRHSHPHRRRVRVTPLGVVAFGFVLAAVLFGGDRAVGYGLLGVGILVAVIDIAVHMRETRR